MRVFPIMSHNVTSPVKQITQECFHQHNASHRQLLVSFDNCSTTSCTLCNVISQGLSDCSSLRILQRIWILSIPKCTIKWHILGMWNLLHKSFLDGNVIVVWQRFCEPSPDLGLPTVRACVCVCACLSCPEQNSGTSKPIPSSYQPKSVNQTSQAQKVHMLCQTLPTASLFIYSCLNHVNNKLICRARTDHLPHVTGLDSQVRILGFVN